LVLALLLASCHYAVVKVLLNRTFYRQQKRRYHIGGASTQFENSHAFRLLSG
jgi:hypothetical protein